MIGEILRHAEKAQQFVHWTTSEVAAKKQQIVQLELQYIADRKRIEAEILTAERNQTDRKVQYDLCMDTLQQARKYAPKPPKVEPSIEVVPVKKTTKKKKVIQVEVDEDDVRDSSASSPPPG